MIEAAGANHALSVSNLLRARYSAGRISLPLEGTGVSYAQFKHVQGVPSPREGEGYSISRLKVLDTLVDRLVQLKGRQALNPEAVQRSPESLDALIDQYKSELHSALLSSNFYTPPVNASGMFFHLSA